MSRKVLIFPALLLAAACSSSKPSPAVSQPGAVSHTLVCQAVRSAWDQLSQDLSAGPDHIQASADYQDFASAVGKHLNQEPTLTGLHDAAQKLSLLEVDGTPQEIADAAGALRAQYQQYNNGC